MTNSSFADLFGDERLGFLASQIQSASIGQGHYLERVIHQMIPQRFQSTLIDVFAGKFNTPTKDIVIHPMLPKSGESVGIVSDFAVFDHTRREVRVIELKYGYQFDTQKAPAAKEKLQTITNYLSQHSHYAGKFFICSWKAVTKLDVYHGFKTVFNQQQIMLARDLCRDLEIDFKALVEAIAKDREANRRYLQVMVDAVRRGVNNEEFFILADEFKTGQLRMRLD